jgi:hypothetical protein
MDESPPKRIDLRTATDEEITETFALGVRAALREHKRAGRPVVVWDRERDQIVVLRPDQIHSSDEPAAPAEHVPMQTPAPSRPE